MTKLQQIVKRAKQIRLAQPKKFAKWTDYIKAASKELAGKSVGSANLLPLLPFPKEKKQTGKTNIKIDKTKQAMAPGKRKASPAAKKPFYYESRANRSDKGRLLGIKIGQIDLAEIGSELFNLEFKIRQLQEQKKVVKLISSKKELANEIKILQSQFKALKSYLNTRAKFV